MPVSRMRMRPWLESKINSKSIAGLTWVDKEKTMFTIPWKHAARHGWELDKDACLFKEWAIHTGKYADGQTCDPKTWKANFRCAMNSLPDIEEVKDRSINKGHQAMRVFRMLPATLKSRDKRNKAKKTKTRRKSTTGKKEEDLKDSSDTQSSVDEWSPDDLCSTQESTVDSTVNTEQTGQSTCKRVAQCEVPDWSTSVEIGDWNNTNSINHKFEVSPLHSPDYDCTEEIIQICEQLEMTSQWLNSNLSSEACTSPESHCESESSSLDDLDDIPQYITLGSDLTNLTNDVWNNLYSHSMYLGHQDRIL